MKTETRNRFDDFPVVARYARRIPEQLWDALIPANDSELAEFSTAVKALRLREEERRYVMDLQRQYGLSLRPNETVKATMIRARLEHRRRLAEFDDDNLDSLNCDDLPVDPLE